LSQGLGSMKVSQESHDCAPQEESLSQGLKLAIVSQESGDSTPSSLSKQEPPNDEPVDEFDDGLSHYSERNLPCPSTQIESEWHKG
jgi:hypothetical protein